MAKVLSMPAWLVMSASKVWTLDPFVGSPSMADLVSFRVLSLRPRSTMLAAWASEKAWAMEAPIPWPPPVMRTVLPAAESCGLVGLMAS